MLKNTLRAIELIQKLSPKTPFADAEKLAPVLINNANAEPWFLSRVTWGAVASILAGISGLIMLFVNGSFDFEQLLLSLTTILGGVTTLWGRWAVKGPLGF